MNKYQEIILEPDPARVMEGLRDTGYDFNMAMADLVDNSIAANATVVKVYLNPMPNSDLKLYIADNGCGMTEDIVKRIMEGKKVSKGKGGVGLQNVQERLRLVFGDGFGMMINSEPDEGTEVLIRIPIVLWEELSERGLDSV